jgi:hypothetical protein
MQKFIYKIGTAAIILGLSSTMALANDSHTTKITADCPEIGSGNEVLRNYGTYIAGTGYLRVNSDVATEPLFQSNIVPGANIPLSLVDGAYFNNGVNYNPDTGAVLCYYSSVAGFDDFSVGYIMQNALNGVVASSSSEEIHIKIPVGLK